jgi:FHA domain/M penetrans paralogue family 26
MQRLRIGRDANNDIVLNDPSVSRNHAELNIQGNTVFIRDTGSANGTFINGNRIYDVYQLSEFDIVKLGNAILPWRNYIKSGINRTIVGGAPQSQPVSPMPSYSTPIPLPNSSATLVLGICSIVFSCFFVGLITGIIGLALGSKAKSIYRSTPAAYTGYGMLNAGFICSIIGTVISGLYVVYAIIWMMILGNAMWSIYNL